MPLTPQEIMDQFGTDATTTGGNIVVDAPGGHWEERPVTDEFGNVDPTQTTMVWVPDNPVSEPERVRTAAETAQAAADASAAQARAEAEAAQARADDIESATTQFEQYFGIGNVPSGAAEQAVEHNWTAAQIEQYALTHGAEGAAVQSTLTEFEQWYGKGQVPSGLVQKAQLEGWTAIQIKRYAITHGANGANAVTAREEVLSYARRVMGSEWASTLSIELIDVLASETRLDNAAYLTNYFADMPDLDVMKSPQAQQAIADWIDATGRPLTWTAKEKLTTLMQQYGGMTNDALTEWNMWIITTDSAKTGNWGATHRADIADTITSILHRAPTADELKIDGEYWDLNEDAQLEKLRATDEYAAIYVGKPAWMDEAQYMGEKAAWNEVYRQAYGIDVAALSGMPGTFGGPKVTEQGALALTQLGVTGWGADTTSGYTVNLPGGATGHFDTLAEAQAMAQQFGVEVTGGPQEVPGAPIELMQWAWQNGVTADQWMQSVQWEQQAIVAMGTYNPSLMETMGIELTQEEWYDYTSKAIGWGETQLKIMEAQNKEAYREEYRNYFGTDPGPADYEAITNTFVSPSEFVHRMAAKESAKAQIGAVNELLGRVLGVSVTLADLENMAMDGQGSGTLRAQIDQATRLDDYRWVFKQKNGTEPTPTDYAKFAGYAGPAELNWELTLAENMAEFGPDIMETWNKVYVDKPLTDAQLRIMLGDMKGSGELKYQLKEAQEVVKKEEAKHEAGFTTPGVNIMFSGSSAGGFKFSMPGIEDLVPSMN